MAISLTIKRPSLGHWESYFKEDLALLVRRCKYSKKSLLKDCLCDFCTDLYLQVFTPIF